MSSRHVIHCTAFLALAIVASVCTGAEKASSRFLTRAFPVSGVQSFSYASRVMQRTFDVSIAFPESYSKKPGDRHPALIVLDGNRFFPMAHFAARALEDGDRVPILIGIDTPFEEGEGKFVRNRVHDFSPPGWNLQNAFGRRIADFCTEEKLQPADCVGGAPKFFRFLVTEFLPDLAEIARIDEQDVALSGASAGGFFTAWAMFQSDSPFRRYIISSPVTAYGESEIYRLEEQYAREHKDFPVEIYMSSGMLEMDDANYEGVAQIVSGQARLAGLLRSRKYPSLVLHNEIHQGLGHVDVIPVTYARGMRLLYSARGRSK